MAARSGTAPVVDREKVADGSSQIDLSPAERQAGLVTLDELRAQPKAPWLIDGIIRQRSLTFLYGRPDTYKTFLALDLCGSLMTSETWLDAAVGRNGPVLYVAAEGSETMVERMSAWEVQHERCVPSLGFQVRQEVLDLSVPHGVDDLCKAVESRPYSAVVIDTFGKSLGTLEENSNSDANQALLRASKLKDRGVAVVIIHHTGHTVDRLRGASALSAAVDTIIKAEVVGDLMVKLSCERQRRSKRFDPIYVRLAEVQIGTDEAGRAETSLVVVGRVSKISGAAAEYGAKRQAVVDYLGDRPEHEATQAEIVDACTLSMNGTARKAFFQGLVDDGLIEKAHSSGKALLWQLSERS